MFDPHLQNSLNLNEADYLVRFNKHHLNFQNQLSTAQVSTIILQTVPSKIHIMFLLKFA
jgi:hypothetical protein